MPGAASGKQQTCLDVFSLEIRKILQNLRCWNIVREHLEDIDHADPHPADARLPPHFPGSEVMRERSIDSSSVVMVPLLQRRIDPETLSISPLRIGLT